MKFLIAGSGGVGGYYGAKLADAGNDVWFLARGRNLEALRSRGIEVRGDLGDVRLESVQATDHDAPPVDAVLFCVKTYDNRSAADAMDGAVREGTIVCSLQNGVDNEVFLRERFPGATVIAGTTRIVAWLEEPGVVRQAGQDTFITVAPFTPEDRPAAEGLLGAFAGAEVPFAVADDAQAALWLKLVGISSVGAITAYRRCTIAEVLADPTLRQLMQDAAREAEAVARARGVELPPGAADAVIGYVESNLQGAFNSSMARDVEAGRPLEVEALNGAVVRHGEAAGVATPAQRTMLDVLLVAHRDALAKLSR